MRTVLFVAALVSVFAGCLLYWRWKNDSSGDVASIAGQEATLGAGNAQSNRTRVLVGPGEPTRGAAEPVVTLIEFCDFRTPACKRTARTLFEAVLAYPNDVRVVFKPRPTTGDAESMTAAEAALAAQEQGKFWEMHDALFLDSDRLDRAAIEDKARRLGLDLTRFRAALDGHTCMPAIEASTAYASKVGVDSVPALFLNGLRIEDASQPFVHLKPRIEAEIKRARSHGAEKGVAGVELYRELMRAARPYSPRPADAGVTGSAAAVVQPASAPSPR